MKATIWHRTVELILRGVLLRDHPLMTKLLVYSALLVVLPLLLVGLLSYNQASEALERETKQYSLQILEQVKHYVEDYFRDFEINTLKILNHPDTVAFLRMKTIDQPVDKDIVKAARNVLKNAAYSRSDVTNITIMLDNIQVIDAADVADDSSVKQIRNESWIDVLPANGEPLIISRIIPWKDREEPVISIVKRIVNPNTLTPFGLLIIDVNYKRLQDAARKVQPGDNGFMYIIDEQSNYVYHPRFPLIGRQADPLVVQAMSEASRGSLIVEGDAKELQTYSRSELLGWQLVTSISYKELMKSTNYIGRTILLTTAIFMLVAYVLGIGFVTSLVRPIKTLHRNMKKVEVGDFTHKVKVTSQDEIGLLSHGFNKMTDQLAKLVQEIYVSRLKQTEISLSQKEMELRMLQAQINPHFLYNSLDTIRGMALQHDKDDISDMAESLARLLRYNVKEGSLKVTVQQEIEVAMTYLRIQKFRFEDKLDYRFHIPEWLLTQQMNKFTLQPIIENCIIHGLEPHSGRMDIAVTAKLADDESFVLSVTDSGPGIPLWRTKQLNDELNQTDAMHDSHNHIGLMNVHRRVRFVFGDQYGISLECAASGAANCGTVVHIRLPFQSSLN